MRRTAVLLIGATLMFACSSDPPTPDGINQINGPAVVETTTTITATPAANSSGG